MSLVAYGSSDDSDSEETSTSAAPESRGSSGGLFAFLPAPKKLASTGGSYGPSRETKASPSAGDSTSNDDLDPQPSKGGLFASLPKPRKRTEPVKITVPQIQRRDVSPIRHLILHIAPPVMCNQAVITNLFVSSSQSDSDDDEPAKKKLQPQVKH